MSFGGVAIDIDRPGIDVRTLANDVLATCLRLGIPEPTAVVQSGRRGVHCYWCFDKRLPGRAALRWRKLVSALATKFHADPACVDPARILRLPGSLHGETRRPCTVVDWTGETVSFEKMFESLMPLARAEVRARKKARQDRQAKRGTRKGKRTNVCADLVRLADHEGGFRKGHRNTAVHISAALHSQYLAGPELEARVFHFAKTCTVPTLPEREVKRAVAMAEAKRQEDGKGYRYSRAGIMTKLAITPERSRAAGLLHLVPDGVSAVERKRRKRVADGRRPHSDSRERAAPWRKANISRSRWYARRKRGMTIAEKRRETAEQRASERQEKASTGTAGPIWLATLGVALSLALDRLRIFLSENLCLLRSRNQQLHTVEN
jgi:hypothetical protein